MGDSEATNHPDIPSQNDTNQTADESQKLKVGGFPEEMFENLTESEKEFFFCNICLNLVNQCQKCSNSHLFCKSCIFMWMNVHSSNAGKCPVCRAPQVEYIIASDVDQKMAEKEVSCPVENCSFKSSLRLFLQHDHGKSLYCNEQKDYTKFKAEHQRSNDETDENERLIELINFIERFNILHSLMSFEALLGNNRSFTLLNLLHSISEVPSGQSPTNSNRLWEFALPLSLVSSFGGLDFPSSSNDDLPRPRLNLNTIEPPNTSTDSVLSRERISNLPQSALRSSVFSSFPGSGRTSSASSIFSADASDSESSSLVSRIMTRRHLENIYDSDDDNDYLSLSGNPTRRIYGDNFQRNETPFDYPDDCLISSASTDTLVDNQAVADDLINNEMTDLRTMASTFEEELGIFPRRDEILNHDSFLDDIPSWKLPLDDDLLSLTEDVDSFEQDDLETLNDFPFDRSRFRPMPPPRLSAMPLMAAKKASKSANNRNVFNSSLYSTSSTPSKIVSQLDSASRKLSEPKKPMASSSKNSFYLERYQLGRTLASKHDRPKVGISSRKEVENQALCRPKPVKTVLKSPKEALYNNEVRHFSNHKIGETSRRSFPVGSVTREEALKLPAIYTSASSRNSLKSNGNSRLPKVVADPGEVSKEKKIFSKMTFSSIGRNKY